MRIATWNINSVRLRVDHVRRFVEEQAPDVLCLQEIKCREGEFPAAAFADMGMPHLAVRGQKGWHGVAIASRLPLEPGAGLGLCRRDEAREVCVRVAGVEIVNLYVPAGGDVPDRALNPKFDHKLEFLERLTLAMAARRAADPLLIAGDLNVAPGEHDVWSHRVMSRIVSHTPVEVEAMARLKETLGFTDLVRSALPEPQKAFSWWSYRARDFRQSARGLRLDHLWASPGLAARALQGPEGARIHADARGWERPSDHAPVVADLRVP